MSLPPSATRGTPSALMRKAAKKSLERIRPNYARSNCRKIVELMKPTERARKRDSVLVMIHADVWKRIWYLAKRAI